MLIEKLSNQNKMITEKLGPNLWSNPVTTVNPGWSCLAIFCIPASPLWSIGACHKRFISLAYNGCLWIFLFKKYLRQISILGTNKYKLRKTKGNFVISTFKVDYTVPLLFLIFNLLVPKIEFSLKYFLDKNPQNQL